MSSPTEKHEASWLKATDKAVGLLELSIAGLVFMISIEDGGVAGVLLIKRIQSYRHQLILSTTQIKIRRELFDVLMFTRLKEAWGNCRALYVGSVRLSLWLD